MILYGPEGGLVVRKQGRGRWSRQGIFLLPFATDSLPSDKELLSHAGAARRKQRPPSAPKDLFPARLQPAEVQLGPLRRSLSLTDISQAPVHT